MIVCLLCEPLPLIEVVSFVVDIPIGVSYPTLKGL